MSMNTKCVVDGCDLLADPLRYSGKLCRPHSVAQYGGTITDRLCAAVEQAITSEDGLDGLQGERLLRDAGWWPPQKDREAAR